MKDTIVYEEYIIAELLNNKSLKLVDTLSKADFKIYGGLFESIRELKETNGEIGLLQMISKSGYSKSELLSIMSLFTVSSQIESNIKSLKEIRAKDQLERIIKKFSSRKIEDPNVFIDKLQVEIMAVSSTSNKRHITYKEAYYKELEILKEKSKNKDVNDMKIGLKKIDKCTGGFHKGELTTIAARPGVGKSLYGLQIATALAQKNKKVLIISAEMTAGEITQRNMVRYTNVRGISIREGVLKDIEVKEINEAGKRKEFENIIIADTIYEIGNIKSKIIEVNPDIAIIDYIGLIDDEAVKGNQREKLSSITRKLKRITNEFNMPIIILAQINREGSFRPKMKDLKDSGTIEEDSNNVYIISEPDSETINGLVKCGSLKREYINKVKESNRKLMLIDIAKQRSGVSGIAPILFNPNKLCFEDWSEIDGNDKYN